MVSSKLLLSSILLNLGNALPFSNTTQVGVYFCRDVNWAGECDHAIFSAGTCYDLPSGWGNAISSLGPDQDAGDCTVYKQTNCVPALQPATPYLSIAYPGTSNLISDGYNDAINSIICAGP